MVPLGLFLTPALHGRSVIRSALLLFIKRHVMRSDVAPEAENSVKKNGFGP